MKKPKFYLYSISIIQTSFEDFDSIYMIGVSLNDIELSCEILRLRFIKNITKVPFSIIF